MDIEFDELKSDSLKDLFVKRFEELIISGKLSIGERLPPERELAQRMGISRTIVHSGIIELSVKGLLTVHPRKGTVVNDYRREGTLSILNSLMSYSVGDMDITFLDSMISTRYLIEVENARLAALNRTNSDLDCLIQIISRENDTNLKNTSEVTNLDFEFHHMVSMCTGNMMYPLIIKSFEPVYKNLTSRFFKDTSVIPTVFDFHSELYKSIERGASDQAASIMKQMLEHGEKVIRGII